LLEVVLHVLFSQLGKLLAGIFAGEGEGVDRHCEISRAYKIFVINLVDGHDM
jgi:hypothetical protein